jgi:hypothetical protein
VLVTGEDVLLTSAGGATSDGSVSNNSSSIQVNKTNSSNSSSGSVLSSAGSGSATIFCLLEDTLPSPGDDTRVTHSDVEVTVILAPKPQQAAKGVTQVNSSSSNKSSSANKGGDAGNSNNNSSSSEDVCPRRRNLLWRAGNKFVKRVRGALRRVGL